MEEQKYKLVLRSPKTGEEVKRYCGPMEGEGTWFEEYKDGNKVAFHVDERPFLRKHSFEIFLYLISLVVGFLLGKFF